MEEVDLAKDYVLRTVILPALESAAVPQKVKDSVRKTKQWIEHCKYVGDIYDYISRFSGLEDNRYSSVYSELKANGLIPIEDIIEAFSIKFKDSLGEKFEVSELIIGESYSSWDIAILARSFNVQRGIWVLSKFLCKLQSRLRQGPLPSNWVTSPV